MRSRKSLVIFDMDGTLVEQKSSWGWLHQYFGSIRGENKLLKLYTDGKITYDQFMVGDIRSWPQPVHVTEVGYALSVCRLRTEAYGVVREIRNRGVQVAMITAGINLLADRVARDLGIRHYLCNSLETNDNGFLTGHGIKKVEPKLKHRIARKMATALGVTPHEIIGVADHEYDEDFLKSVGVGLVFQNPQLAERARLPSISSLLEVLEFLT